MCQHQIIYTSVRLLSELRQRSIAPKQKQLVQPLGLVGSRWNVPTLHWSQWVPWTFSCAGGTGTQQVRTHNRFRGLSSCACVFVSYLAETLPCEGVTHFLFSSCLIAVTWSAVGVTIETGGTAVTLTSDNVVPTSVQNKNTFMRTLLSVCLSSCVPNAKP